MKKKIKICIVRSKYNQTSRLLKSATNELIRRKMSYKILEVPGAFEIPVVISRNINNYDGFIAIGSIIKGETPNFNFISSAITNGLIQLMLLCFYSVSIILYEIFLTDQGKIHIEVYHVLT